MNATNGSYTERERAMVVVCEVPTTAEGFADLFTYEPVDGLVVRLINQADTTVYGCIDEIQWDVYQGDSLIRSVNAWSPKIDFTEEGAGDYRVVLTLGDLGRNVYRDEHLCRSNLMPTLDVQVLEMEWVVSSCLVLPSLDLVWLEDAKTDSDCTTKSTNVHDAPSHSAALGLCAFIDEHRTIVRTKCNRRVDRHSAGSIYRVHDLCQSVAQHIRRNGHHPHHQWMEIGGHPKWDPHLGNSIANRSRSLFLLLCTSWNEITPEDNRKWRVGYLYRDEVQ